MEIEIASTSYSSTSTNTAFDNSSAGGATELDAGGEDARKLTCFAWENLTVVLPNFGKGSPRKLLQGLNGYAVPGRIMAIMGPSGSGKSTLLDSLAGRLSRNVIRTGDVLFNGKKKRADYGAIAYVTQEDVLLGTLTARETLTYSALLRFPASMTKEEVTDTVEGTLTEMGLQECADTIIGSWQSRGISGGEKKRLSIALEILTKPRLLFLDEPTSGLDSASAFFVIQTLRNIACDGRTVISSIHQPSSEVFALFDDLCLLSGGETVYFGEAKTAIEFFAEAGFPCPRKRNPSDHFLRCVNTDFDTVTHTLKGSIKIRDEVPHSSDPFMNMVTSEIKARLVEKYRRSNYAKKTREMLQKIAAIEGSEVKVKSVNQASWWKQLKTLTGRSLVNMSRDVGYYWARIVTYLIVSICVGSIFYDVGYSYTAILARVSCGAFISGFMTFMSIGGFPSFIEELKIFTRERLNGHYGIAVYIVSNFISSFPFLVAIAWVTGTVTFSMVKFHPGFSFSHYAFFCLNLLLSITVVESLMMIVASLVPNFLMGVITGAGIIGIIMMTSGFFRLLPDLPKPFWRYPVSYISYGAWAIQGSYKNDFLGLEFDPLIPGEPKLQGEYIIKTIFGIAVERSKWWDLTAICAILISYRVLFFIILKFKERAFPLVDSFYAKKTMKRLNRRPSFITNKMPSFSSNRHQNLHSLSSQEGRNSPLQ